MTNRCATKARRTQRCNSISRWKNPSRAGHLVGRLGDAAEAAAERDYSPDHPVPIPPHRFRLLTVTDHAAERKVARDDGVA